VRTRSAAPKPSSFTLRTFIEPRVYVASANAAIIAN
jgi:hypothetical protein